MESGSCAIRFLFLSIFWWMWTGSVFGQADTLRQDSVKQRFLTLKGCVVGGDEKELLPGAYIYLGEEKVPIMTTNENGHFIIPRVHSGKVRISVSYTGFQSFSEEYEVKKDLDLGEILLKSIVLDEVKIKVTPPLVLQHGDTTQFNAAALKVAVDADLEELLKKLPGFEIVDGKIMAQGEEVKKLYIDGMEYSFNDPAAALKNLPAKLVNKIKMYDDRSEQAKFSGYDDGQKFRSLNIETHDPDKMKIFGQAMAGYGITDPVKNTFKENNYQGYLSANLFDRKRKVTVNGNIMNQGQNNNLPDTRYQGKGGDNNSHSAYVNVSAKLSKKVDFSGNYHFSDNNSYSASSSNQNYFPTDRYNSRIYDRESHSWGDGMNQSLNIHTDIRLNDHNRISFSPVFSASRNNSHSLSFSSNVENQDTVSISDMLSRGKNNNWSAGGDAVWMHAFQKKGRTFTLSLNGNYSRNSSDQLQNNQERSLNNDNNYKDTLRNLLINGQQNSYSWNASVTWSEPLTEHARLGFNYSYRENEDNSDKESLSYKDREFQELIGIDTAQTNELSNSYRVHNYGVNYNYYLKKIRVNGGLSLSHTRMNNHYNYLFSPDSLVKSVYTNISPMVNAGYKVNKNSNLDFNYRGSSSSPNARQLQDVLDVTNPLQVSKGNPGLKKSYNHSMSLGYNRSAPEKSVFWNANVSAGQTFNQIASNVKFIRQDTLINGYMVLRGARLTTPVNLNGNWNVSGRVSYSFPWKKLKLRINTALNYNYSHSPSIYDDLKNMTTAHAAAFNFSVNSNISENFDFVLSSNSSYSYSRNSTTGSAQYFNESLNTYLRWIFWKGWYVLPLYRGSFYINKKGEKVNQMKHLLNVQLGKKLGKNKNLDISLAANDILDEKNAVNYTLSDLYAETSYRTMPSNCYMLVFSYRFNSMNKRKDQEH